MKTAEAYAKNYLNREVSEIQRSDRNGRLLELTVYEKAIIFKYSNDGYENLNENLRMNSGRNDSEFGELLDAVLSKLSDFDGVVYRGANLTLSELDKYMAANKINESLYEPTFISTSKSRLIAMEFRGNTLFRIYSKTGKEIENIAKFGMYSPQNEKEVLFKPGRQFKVLDVNNQDTFTLISMEEI